MSNPLNRCSWVNNDPLYQSYHDEEWGVPEHDALKLFELFCLEGQQAGLSWFTVLKRRESMRRVFDGFDPDKLARWTDEDMARALLDPGIIRLPLKVQAVVKNARAFLVLRDEGIDFADYLWSFAPTDRYVYAHARTITCPESDAMSKALKKRGFGFCGSTICYAFMQACGMVDDHGVGCFRYKK